MFVKTTNLYSIVELAYREGYSTIFIDEIHKYPKWTDELKNIYDDFFVQIVASGSSVAAIKKGSVLLGRRAEAIEITPLTFGEFTYLKENSIYRASLHDVFDRKSAIRWLANHKHLERSYRYYLTNGGFPTFKENTNTIISSIKKMIYEDALAEFNLTKNKVDVCERLLSFLALSKPGEFSYTSFSSMSGYSKSTIYEAVSMLKELNLLSMIGENLPKSAAKGLVKLLFYHPNLRAAFCDRMMREPNIGALREEYFLFHMKSLGFTPHIPKKGKKNPDYILSINNEDILFEIGGESKTSKQIGKQTGIVIRDDNLIVLGFVQNPDQK